MDKLIVLCVDRDNDLGKKTGINGPVIGREKNLEAASALALADPSEADANTIFAAVKKFDELKKTIRRVEVATITGHGKSGFRSDLIINEQLDVLVKKFKPEGFVLVTDGAEDDQVIPILQSRARIVSKEVVIIKQAQQIESAFYTIKETLKDPYFARIFFGIPGVAILLFAIFGMAGLQIVGFSLGAVLIMFGLGIMEPLLDTFRGITGSISIHRMSFLLYFGSILIIAFGLWTGYTNFLTTPISNIALDYLRIAQTTYPFFVLAALIVVFGRCVDVVHFKKAYLLRKYFLTGISIFLLWWILDSATLVFLREVDLNFFLVTILGSFLALLISFRISSILDVREKVTKLLVGLPIYTLEGTWLGSVEAIDKRKKSITYKERETNKSIELTKRRFSFRKGKLVITG